VRLASTRLAITDFPAPDRPVNHRIAARLMFELSARLPADREIVTVNVGRAAQAMGDHARRRRFVGEPVDQNEGAGVAIVRIGIKRRSASSSQIAETGPH